MYAAKLNVVAVVVSCLVIAAPAMGQPYAMGTAFTYQGHLVRSGAPVTDACSLEFSLWDAFSGGSQVGSTLAVNTAVIDGMFTATLDFGSGAFNGDARWLEIVVQCPGDPDPVTLSPLQALTPTPYAIFAQNVAGSGAGNTLDQAYDQGGPGVGRTITADAGSVHIAGLDGLSVDANIRAGGTVGSGNSILLAWGGSVTPQAVPSRSIALLPTGRLWNFS